MNGSRAMELMGGIGVLVIYGLLYLLLYWLRRVLRKFNWLYEVGPFRHRIQAICQVHLGFLAILLFVDQMFSERFSQTRAMQKHAFWSTGNMLYLAYAITMACPTYVIALTFQEVLRYRKKMSTK